MPDSLFTARRKPVASGVTLEQPRVSHGADIHRLIEACPPLDVNSTYLYLLLCEHFAGTCVRATRDDGTVGFVSAYCPPGRADVVFVWQVAVAAQVRGQGLAHSMLLDLLARDAVKPCRYLETTVSPSNDPSRAVFHALAKTLAAPLSEKPLFLETHFGREAHESETLIRIGPFTGASTQ